MHFIILANNILISYFILVEDIADILTELSILQKLSSRRL